MPTYKVKFGDKEYSVTVRESAGRAHVVVEGRAFEVEPAGGPAAATPAGTLDTRSAPPVTPTVARAGTAAPTRARPTPAAPPPRPVAAARPVTAAGSGAVQAPIPGVITKVLVGVGDKVGAGQVVVKLEAMKMENDIACDVNGTVAEVAVSEGSEVREGQLLVRVA